MKADTYPPQVLLWTSGKAAGRIRTAFVLLEIRCFIREV